MADKEATRKSGGPIVVCDAPDVCLTPSGPSMTPIPYQIFALAAEANVYCASVRFKGSPALNLTSEIPIVHGDEPGVGGGVKSGVNVNTAKPIDGSTTINSEKANIVRHTSKWQMNNGNTLGTLQEPTGSAGAVSPGGVIEGANSQGEPPTPEESSFTATLKGAVHHTAGFAKGAGGALWDMASGLGNMVVAGAKLSPVSQAAESLSQMTGIGGYTGYTDTQNAISDTASAIYENPGAVWDAISKPYSEAWAAGEYGEALGRGTVDIGSFFLGGGAGAGAKGASAAGKLGEAANVAGHLGEVGRAGEAANVAGHLGETAKVAEAGGHVAEGAKAGEAMSGAAKGTGAAEQSIGATNKADDLAKVEKVADEGKAAEAAGKDGAVVKRSVRLREKYLGKTPGKNSRTGREVMERMEKEGKLRTGPDGSKEFLASDGKWYDVSKADMAHKTDAVSWWNETGRQYGAKSPEVRKWMLDPDNYTLDHYSLNRSAGAGLGQRYLPPLK